MPAPAGGWRSTPCQLGMKRASARWSAGSISLRSAASDARRSRRSTSGSHHSRRVPPGRSSPRTRSPRLLERLQHGREVDAVAGAQLARLERPVHARPAAHEPLHRVRHVLAERLGQPGGRHGAERVAEQAGVLGGGPAQLAADADAHRPALALELLEPRLRVVDGRRAPAPRRSSGRRSAAARRAARRPSPARVRSDGPLQVGLDLLQRAGVDQLAQLLLARAARAAARGRAPAPRRGAPRWACRPRTCTWRRSRTAARRRTARRSASQPRPATARASAACAAGPAGRGRRARRAGTRGRSRARSGTARSAWRPRAASATSAAAATAACAGPGRRAGSAARGRRSRGSARRTGPSRRARRRRGPRARRGRSARGPRRAARRRRAGGR